MVVSVLFTSNCSGNMFGVAESSFIGGSGDPSNANRWNLGPSIGSKKICQDWYISGRW